MMCDMSPHQATLSGGTDELISAAVRGLIAQRRAKPAEVAAAAGISRGGLYRKMGGGAPWLAEEVDRLANFFSVTRDELYEGRAEFRPESAAILDERTRSSTDRASDYGSGVGHFRPTRRRRSDRRRHSNHVVPLRLVA